MLTDTPARQNDMAVAPATPNLRTHHALTPQKHPSLATLTRQSHVCCHPYQWRKQHRSFSRRKQLKLSWIAFRRWSILLAKICAVARGKSHWEKNWAILLKIRKLLIDQPAWTSKLGAVAPWYRQKISCAVSAAKGLLSSMLESGLCLLWYYLHP